MNFSYAMFKGSRQRRLVPLLLTWYRRQHRNLPWRGVRDPYRVLLSEVMLQQTQAARVAQKYPAFLRRFPTVYALAAASGADVVRAWEGMGYNARAVRLHRMAQAVVKQHAGEIPREASALASLPGVGPYTLAAVQCFAFGAAVAVVDVNVTRVLSRLSRPLRRAGDLLPAVRVRQIADALVPPGRASDWNQALMDLGALVCTARSPRCGLCPVAAVCPSRDELRPSPRRPPRREPARCGVPNRIIKGRIVQVLRTLNGRRTIPATALARRVAPGFTARERDWLLGLLSELQEEGLVRVGSGRTASVRLA